MKLMLLLWLLLLLLSVQHIGSFGSVALKCHKNNGRVVTVTSRYMPSETTMRMVFGKNEKRTGGDLVATAGTINTFQRVLLAAGSLPFLAHKEEIPLPIRQLISPRARIILAFCAEYLAYRRSTDGWDVDLYANGGYVRDLLLGRVSPDLDLSLGLARCPLNVTVAAVADGMGAFCCRRPDLAVERVEVMSSRSGAAVLKDVDSAQIVLTIGGEAVCIDLLPTIKSETYCGNDRVPRRDPRGSAEEDSLRRDLTIGSMLLEVSLQQRTRSITKKRENNPSKFLRRARQQMSKMKVMDSGSRNRSSNKNVTGTVAAVTRATSELCFVLLDYHGGIEDLSTRTLRCPVPCNATLSEIYNQVIQSSEEEELALSLGLDLNDDRSSSYFSSSGKIQALWWAKMLRDDPYRLLRTLRFKETLGFRIDPSFWMAVPFALRPGIFNKVSHTRKLDELRKVAAAGATGAISFLATILSPRIGSSALRDEFFATPLLPDSGNLGVIDIVKAQKLARELPPASSLSLDERVGAALIVSFFSCESSGKKSEKIDTSILTDTNSVPSGATADVAPAHKYASVAVSSRLGQTLNLVEAACDGIRAPTSIRRAATDPILVAIRLLEPLNVLGMHYLLAQAVGLPSGGVSRDQQAQQYANMVRIWELLLSARRKPSSPNPFWVLTLLSASADDCIRSGNSSPSSGEMVRQIEVDARLLLSLSGEERLGGVALGGPVAGLAEIPAHLRGHMVAAVQVLMRLRGDSLNIQTPEQLRTYLEVDLDNLLTKLGNEWWVCDGGTAHGNGSSNKECAKTNKKLRSVYAKKKKR